MRQPRAACHVTHYTSLILPLHFLNPSIALHLVIDRLHKKVAMRGEPRSLQRQVVIRFVEHLARVVAHQVEPVSWLVGGWLVDWLVDGRVW